MGGRYHASVKRLMIAHVLETFEKAIFLIGRDNIRSRRAIEKIGAVLTDRVVVAQVEDSPVSHVVYTVDRQTFARGPLARPRSTV